MKIRPILFNSQMVQALLANKKTCTRRVIKLQPDEDGLSFDIVENKWLDSSGKECKCPYGDVGDFLYVRESGYEFVKGSSEPEGCHHDRNIKYIYSADGDGIASFAKEYNWKSRPSIHMPRKYSRLSLCIKNIKVERLQDISEEDPIDEGVDSKSLFICLWNSINAKRGLGWDTNPWLWCVEFDVFDCNVDKLVGMS